MSMEQTTTLSDSRMCGVTGSGVAAGGTAKEEFRVVRRVKTESQNVDLDESIRRRNRLILKEVVSVVDKAMEGRHRLILDFMKEKKQGLEEDERRREELGRAEAEVEALRRGNEAKRRTIQALEAKLEASKKMPELNKQLSKLHKLQEQHGTMLAQVKELEDEQRKYEELEEALGVAYVGKVEEEGEESDRYLVIVSRIHPLFPQDPYYVYFSAFHFTHNGIQFTPVSVEPAFPEFQVLKEEFLDSADLPGFIARLSHFWKRDAGTEASPRLATPRRNTPHQHRRSLKTEKEK